MWVPKTQIVLVIGYSRLRRPLSKGDAEPPPPMKRKSRHVVIMSLCYWILHRPLELAVLVLHSEEAKEVEIVVLRHQLHVLNRQVKGPVLKPHERALLAAPSRFLPKGAGPLVGPPRDRPGLAPCAS